MTEDLSTAAAQQRLAEELAQSIVVGDGEDPVTYLDLLDSMASAGLMFAPTFPDEPDLGDRRAVHLLVDDLEANGHGGVDPAHLDDLLDGLRVYLTTGHGAGEAYLKGLAREDPPRACPGVAAHEAGLDARDRHSARRSGAVGLPVPHRVRLRRLG